MQACRQAEHRIVASLLDLPAGMERIIESHAALWEQATASHPFILRTGDGSIPEAAFNRWLMQVSTVGSRIVSGH